MRKTLHAIFADEPTVQAVYLFSSYASGRARPESDVDLGVVVHDDASMPDKVDLLASLFKRGMDNVDLVFLHRVDPVVRYEAVRPNVLVYRTEAFDHGSYYSAGDASVPRRTAAAATPAPRLQAAPTSGGMMVRPAAEEKHGPAPLSISTTV